MVIKENIQERGSNIRQAVECVKDRKKWKTIILAVPSSAKDGWKWRKESEG